MSRWLLVLLLGWLVFGAALAQERLDSIEHEAAMRRACPCVDGASVVLVEAPAVGALEERLAELVLRHQGKPRKSAQVGALGLQRLQLAVDAGAVDLELTAELPPEATQLAFLFESRWRAADGTERVRQALAFAPKGQLAALGKDRCRTELPIAHGAHVTAAIAALDAAGNVSPASKVVAQLTERKAGLPSCRVGYRCGLGAAALAMLGLCTGFIAFLVLVAGLMTVAQRRSLFALALAEPISLGALDRVCTRERRDQVAYLVLALASAVALALRYPANAEVALPMLPFALLAAWRYRLIHRLQRAAEHPTAAFHRRGPSIEVTGPAPHRAIFRPSLLERALLHDLPAMHTSNSSK